MRYNGVAFKRTPRSVRYQQSDLLFIKFICANAEQKPNQLKLQIPRPTTAFRLRRWLYGNNFKMAEKYYKISDKS